MTIEELTHKDHPDDIEYEIIVSTDSSIERDIIKVHLAQAQEEYKTWIKRLTKPSISHSTKQAKVEFSMRDPKVIDDFSAVFCPCGLTHYFKSDCSGWWSVKCPDPDCNFQSSILINKDIGGNNNGK